MQMLWLAVLAASMWLLQCALGLWQYRRFSRQWRDLRREGRVAVGAAKGRVRTGAIVLLCMDGNCRVLHGKRLQGLTVFAGVKAFDALNGLYLPGIDEAACAGLDAQTKRAVLNAVENYRAFASRQEAQGREEGAESACAANLQ